MYSANEFESFSTSDFTILPHHSVYLLNAAAATGDNGKKPKSKQLGGSAPKTSSLPSFTVGTKELPVELVDYIIFFIDDIETLRACSVICSLWHAITLRYICYTLTTDNEAGSTNYRWPQRLKKSHKFLPIVNRSCIRQALDFAPSRHKWREKHFFGYFSKLKTLKEFRNLQELGIDNFQASKFVPYIEKYFGHLAPTLRFLALSRPIGSSRQILYFIGLFKELRDLKLCNPLSAGVESASDSKLKPFSEPPLCGWLTLSFTEEFAKDMVDFFPKLRFHYMNFYRVKHAAWLFEACSETLETLWIKPNDPYGEDPPKAMYIRTEVKKSQRRFSIFHRTNTFERSKLLPV